MTTKEYILDGSAKLFTELGVKAVRMDDIAAQLAVSKRTIYELFRDKRDIVAQSLEWFSQKNRIETSSEIAADNIIQELINMLRWWESTAEATTRFIKDVYRFYPDIYGEFNDRHAVEKSEMMRARLRDGVEQGYLVPWLDIDMTLYVVSNSVSMLVFGEKSTMPAGATRNDVFRYIVVYFFRGIATEKGRGILDEYINNNK